MKLRLPFLLFVLLSLGTFLPAANAQLVNFEDTWHEFLKESKTASISELVKPATSSIDYPKYCLMNANSFFCAGDLRKAEEMMAEIKKFGVEGYSKVPGLKDRYDDLAVKIAASHKVDALWKKFLSDKTANLEELKANEAGKTVCEKGTLAKFFYLTAYAHYCQGDVAQSKEFFEKWVLQLVEKTSFKAANVTGLPEEIKTMKSVFAGLAKLDPTWKSFIETDSTKGYDYDLPIVKCYTIPNMKACILQAKANPCQNGPAMYDKIKELKANNSHEIEADLQKNIDWLEKEVKQSKEELSNLNAAWTKSVARHKEKSWEEFPPMDSSFAAEINLVDFYCDKIAQVKSWTIKGHVNACENGQANLDLIAALKKQYSLSFDKELACQVDLLKAKVYQCRYWEIVLQARKETHEERERFGPESAKKMYADLNTGKQPCETGVLYQPIGHIGIKYTINTYLCQNVDLAKMGDPEYYKKIATWVDNEVLKKYCEANMRCKKEFFIYLEGHTDGNPFEFASYKQSLGIPKGYPFTHFLGDSIPIEKKTEREMTTTLKSNMELGIARAWTVKAQLEFMNVPITIGAYEHPSKERGGEFRKVDIKLNITNLLLDFYEKRLKELLQASGIGERPVPCK